MPIPSTDLRWKAAGAYNPVISKLVSHLDVWEDIAKDGGEVTKALEALDQVEAMLKADKEGILAKLPGLDRYAPQQHIDTLREKLHQGQRAGKHILNAYDALNDAFLRMGLK